MFGLEGKKGVIFIGPGVSRLGTTGHVRNIEYFSKEGILFRGGFTIHVLTPVDLVAI